MTAAALVLATGSARASEFADPVGSFGVDLEERGTACVVVPAERFDPSTCASITSMRPEQLLAKGTPNVVLVGSEAVRADGWTYVTMVLREAHVDQHEIDRRVAESTADFFVSRWQGTEASSGAKLARTGAVSLFLVGDIQVIRFDAVAGVPPGSPLASLSQMGFAVAIAHDAVYTIEVWGPPERADAIHEILDASVRTIRAPAPVAPPAYRRGLGVMRAGTLVFLLCAFGAGLVALVRRTRRLETASEASADLGVGCDGGLPAVVRRQEEPHVRADE
jgi:hypothetical protein